MNNQNHSENNTDLEVFWKSQIKNYEEFMGSRAGIEKNSLGCYRINLTRNICSEGYKKKGRDIKLLDNVSVDAFFEFVCLRVEDEERVDEYKRIFNRDNLLNVYKSGKKYVEFEHMYLRMSNQRRWVRTRIDFIENPYTKDAEGIIYVEDITDIRYRKMMIDALIKKQFELMICVDAITGEYTLYLDKDTKDTMMYTGNDYKNALLHFSQLRVCEECREDFINTISIINMLDHLQYPDSQYSKVFKLLSDDGNITYQQLDFMYMDYKSRQILITYTDITKSLERERTRNDRLKKALIELEEANRAKSEFLSRMSHDMRTPMNGIIGLTDILLKNPDISLEVRNTLLEMKDAQELLLSLVNDVLDMQRIEKNKISLNEQFYPFMDIVKNIENCIKIQLDNKNIDFNISFKGIRPCRIYVDKLRISQIFINILSNSIKFTSDGGRIQCNINKIADTDTGCKAEIIISDNGIGMSEDFLKHIFEPFEQEGADTGSDTGTGLGMAIVYNLIEMMGGSIKIDSKKGVGTTTRVCLKLKTDYSRLESNEAVYKKITDEVSLEGVKVLLCEDNALNRRVAESMLKERGIQTVTAVNGKEAVDIFNSSDIGYFDIILMDIRMPVMNGLDATRMIREADRQDAKTIPVIALTANAYNDEIKLCKEAGMNNHISKPVNIQIFYSVIEDAVLNNKLTK